MTRDSLRRDEPLPGRRGIAVLVVMGLVMVILPVVMVLSFRSHSTLTAHAKLEYQKMALELAQQGVVAARESLYTNTQIYQGAVQVPGGGMLYRILYWSRGQLSQPIYLLAGEGVYMGEERLALSLVEVLPGTTADPTRPPTSLPVIVEHDREWMYSENGGSPIIPDQLLNQFLVRVANFLTRLRADSLIPASQYKKQLMLQVDSLDCDDVAPHRDSILTQIVNSQFQ
jgi:hypothetical protein